jgi:hypothetical protein
MKSVDNWRPGSAAWSLSDAGTRLAARILYGNQSVAGAITKNKMALTNKPRKIEILRRREHDADRDLNSGHIGMGLLAVFFYLRAV